MQRDRDYVEKDYLFNGLLLTHEINHGNKFHRLTADDGSSPWVPWHLPLTYSKGQRRFVAQMVMDRLPVCFEVIPPDDYDYELIENQ